MMNHRWFTTFISLHMRSVVQLSLVNLRTSSLILQPLLALEHTEKLCREEL